MTKGVVGALGTFFLWWLLNAMLNPVGWTLQWWQCMVASVVFGLFVLAFLALLEKFLVLVVASLTNEIRRK